MFLTLVASWALPMGSLPIILQVGGQSHREHHNTFYLTIQVTEHIVVNLMNDGIWSTSWVFEHLLL